MALHHWLVFSLGGLLVACSGSDDEEACAPANVVDDDEIVSASQALSPGQQVAVVRAIASLDGAPQSEAAARVWSEAPGSPERALVRDLVETAWIDRDLDVAARLVADASLLASPDRQAAAHAEATHTALRWVVVGGDLVLALSDGERAGVPYQYRDLFRVADGRVVERWSGQRPSNGEALAVPATGAASTL